MAKGGCKCKKSAECEECPEWIFTFADLVMLMMGFFVILWVTKPTATADQAANGRGSRRRNPSTSLPVAFCSAFGYIPDAKSKDPVDIANDSPLLCIATQAGDG